MNLIIDFITNYQLNPKKNFKGITSFAILSCFEEENTIDFQYMNYLWNQYDKFDKIENFIKTKDFIEFIRTDEFI